jgi:polysaccharide export outer membrane protein
MKRTLFCLAAMWAALAPAVWAAEPSGKAAGGEQSAGLSVPKASAEPYRIGPGDILSISVWKDEFLTQQVTVLPDGTLSFPLIGEIRADGRTVAELKADITLRLARYIPEATISVQVMQVNSQVIYVIGKVNGPGRFPLAGRLNVLQALALAGGLNPFAKSGRIRIFRESGQGSRMMFFDYDEVAKGEGLDQNIQLERGDVIVVH